MSYIHEQMMVELLHTGHLYDQALTILMKRHGLTNSQYNILRILKGALPDSVNPGELKERMVFQNSDVTRLIDRLVGKDLVFRQICPSNRRKVDMTITKKGEKLLEKIYPEMKEITNNFYSEVLSAEEAKEFTQKLKILKSNL